MYICFIFFYKLINIVINICKFVFWFEDIIYSNLILIFELIVFLIDYVVNLYVKKIILKFFLKFKFLYFFLVIIKKKMIRYYFCEK